MKYIDAEKLVREIENIALFPTKSTDYNDGREDVKMMILDIIDSLQQEQPEVDLEKEYKRFINCDSGRSMYDCARHFYELGLNARKEE